MAVTGDEAASDAGGGSGQAQNPIPNGNPNQNPNPNPNTNPNSPYSSSKGSKGKSCKGYAYYTSVHKAKSKNPTCIGFTRTLNQVPPYFVGETELQASKEGRSLTNFKYACMGYSVYLDNKDSSAGSQDKTAKLPYCVGLELVVEEKSATSPVGHAPAHAHKNEGHEHPISQPRKYDKPPNTTAEEFLNRFQRNATLVAYGVARNLNRVGKYVKRTLDDILYRRPK